ncbi:MAG: hypothetical protein JWQ76_819, partial [Ramlibacter sp.]|nr:hypothetical protein [Ramlibacter sp.]
QRPFLAGRESDGQPFQATWRELGSFGPALPLYPEGLAELLASSQVSRGTG